MTRAGALLVAALAAAGCAKPSGSAVAPELPAIVATCADTGGEVQVRRGGKAFWEGAATGSVLLAGNWLKTGAGAYARVEFVAGGSLEVEEKAVVVIDLLPASGDAGGGPRTGPVVAVESGEVRGTLSASPDGETRHLVIRNADGSQARLSARAGSRPVEYRLTGSKKGTLVSVLGGDAVLAAPSGERALAQGQASRVTAQGPAAVEQLIDFPQSVEPGVDARLQCGEGLPVRLGWRPVGGARGYRVEVAEDLSFQKRAERHDGEQTSWDFSPKTRGVYAWRVAAQDAQGRFGEFGFARRIYCEAEPPRDLLVGPGDAASFGYVATPPRITFSWQSASASRYRLVVASDPELRHVVTDRLATEQQVDVEGLEVGEYYWGAYAQDGSTPRPIFLKPRKLTLKKVSAARVKTVKSIKEWGG